MYVKWKEIHLIIRLMKKILNNIIFKWNSLITSESVLSKPFRSFGGNINVKVDLSSYATKTDLQNVTHVDTSRFALKANLASLKTKVDKLNIGKLQIMLILVNRVMLLKMMLLKKLCMINLSQK